MAEVAHVIWMKNAADTPTYKESDISLPEKQDPSVGLPLMSGENKFRRLVPSVGAESAPTFLFIMQTMVKIQIVT